MTDFPEVHRSSVKAAIGAEMQAAPAPATTPAPVTGRVVAAVNPLLTGLRDQIETWVNEGGAGDDVGR